MIASEIFGCPKQPGSLRLTPAACAAMWRRGRRAEPWEAARLCRGCAIGAAHAGEPIVVQPPETLCCRCGRTGGRLVRGQLCVSCYNREREAAREKFRRGRPPRHPLDLRLLPVLLPGGRVMATTAADPVEAALWVARVAPGAAVGRVPPAVLSAAPGLQLSLLLGV